jgi:hypothetical protein
MVLKSLIRPEKRRMLRPPFAWIDRRFLFDGFLARLSAPENLLYFFLVLVADRDGLSYYSYDKICQRLRLAVDDYIQARNGLIEKELIAFDGRQYQVLALPAPPSHSPQSKPKADAPAQAQSLAEIFSALAQAR